nr:UDP-N-acetylglucosamine--N-acetylmuramyl-(pentapeptide) pyrophosphoryl-undecaprenol N-acetylglucosamine transferase [Olsenella sp. Marseille-P4559]
MADVAGTSLEVAIAAGGTAGHINPALALAEELFSRGHHVRFFGQSAKLEGTLVPQAGFVLEPIHVTGFDRSRPWTLVSALVRERKASARVGEVFAEKGAPDVAVGFGAYVELPLMDRCRKRRIPYVLHEQNSVPGLANKTLASNARYVCVSLPQARAAFEGRVQGEDSIVLTGNPVRRSVLSASRKAGRAAFSIPGDATMLLVFGGSLGAQHVNEAIARLKARLLADPKLYVVHSTGKELYDGVVASLALTDAERERWQVVPYISNMGEALAAADLVVSRAGASSIAEIAALAVPSVLVPYPLATGDHQTTNAHYLADAGAATLFADGAIDGGAFADDLLALVGDAGRRERMRACARGLGQDQAAAKLADVVERAAAR